MPKSAKRMLRSERASARRLRSVEDAIPITRIWRDGVFLLANGNYSKTIRITDVNYAIASKEDKEALFVGYSELLNSLDSTATTKMTVAMRRIDASELGRRIMIPERGDGLDKYRREYNDMISEKASGANSMVREIYMTVSVKKRKLDDARTFFNRVFSEVGAHLARLGSRMEELDAAAKLEVLHGFYRTGEEGTFSFDMRDSMMKGHSFMDSIVPDSLEVSSDDFKMGKRFGRALYLREYASFVKDSIVSDLVDMKRPMMLSIDIIPVPTDEAVREVENRLLGVETNITNWTRKQNENLNYNVVVPYDMEQQRKEAREFLDDLVARDQRMMLAVVTLVHTADTKGELDADTDAILSTARKHLCQMSVLRFQQLDGLNTALPIGIRRIDALRTLTTESVAALTPFRAQEIMDTGGIYFGENAISRNLILSDKSKLMNPNSFVLGVPGAGKSFITKELIVFLALSTDDDIIICDPEREYAPLIEAAVEQREVTEIVLSYAEDGTPVESQETTVRSTLRIKLVRKTAQEAADLWGFTAEQRDILAEMLEPANAKLWQAVLHGATGSGDIVEAAASQIGNVGGAPYWSWYGFPSRVEWCACFVSWCANECGYIEAGVVPKFSYCPTGVQWFRDAGLWAPGGTEPAPGDIVFFDWNGDGTSDHVGIVESCDGATVRTIEGNSGDSCRRRSYGVTSSSILGYGTPMY